MSSKINLGDLPDTATINTILALAADDLLTPDQARRELNLKSRQTIYNWIHDNEHPLRAIKAGGWKIRRGDLAAYVLAKQNKGKGAEPAVQPSDEALRKLILRLIEIARAGLECKRAAAIMRAASESLELEFIERSMEELGQKRNQLAQLLGPITEQSLTQLRFMLPSITSSLALATDVDADESAEQHEHVTARR
ncbi:MAG TPA: helix-turn-helix domain-containing protein [Pyrinomonadaceae bacterium]|jgi:hypothetical protein